MMLKLPKRVHRKQAKGRFYYYFVSSRRDDRGKPVMVRLPDFASNGFYRAYAACLEREEAAAETALTVPAFCDAFERSPRFQKKAASTQANYRTYLPVIRDQLDTFEAHEVERRDVLALMDKMADRPGAANQTARVLSALYAWGISNDLVKHNPAAGVEFFEEGEHEPWPEWLVEKALKAKDQRVRLAVHLLYYTAQRIGDVLRMKWSDIENDHWIFRQEKTDTEMQIPLHRDLKGVLATVEKGINTPIIRKPNGKHYTVGTVRRWLQDFASEQGAEIVPHGLRKNAVNALLEAGATVAQTQAVSGQSLQMVEHYARKRNRKKLAGDAIKLWENGA